MTKYEEVQQKKEQAYKNLFVYKRGIKRLFYRMVYEHWCEKLERMHIGEAVKLVKEKNYGKNISRGKESARKGRSGK